MRHNFLHVLWLYWLFYERGSNENRREWVLAKEKFFCSSLFLWPLEQNLIKPFLPSDWKLHEQKEFFNNRKGQARGPNFFLLSSPSFWHFFQGTEARSSRRAGTTSFSASDSSENKLGVRDVDNFTAIWPGPLTTMRTVSFFYPPWSWLDLGERLSGLFCHADNQFYSRLYFRLTKYNDSHLALQGCHRQICSDTVSNLCLVTLSWVMATQKRQDYAAKDTTFDKEKADYYQLHSLISSISNHRLAIIIW